MRKFSHGEKPEPTFEKVLSQLRILKARTLIGRGSVVADLGCGYSANFLVNIAENIKSGEGYDISVKKRGLPKNIALKKADLNGKKGFKKNCYDYVSALAVLEHVQSPKNFLFLARSLLKNGGKLIITTPHKKLKPVLEFLAYKARLVSHHEISDHKNYFDEKSLKKLLKVCGFEIVKVGTFELGLNLYAVAQKKP